MPINSVTLAGNMTRDMEIRHSGGGMAIASFSLAVNERVKDPHTGDWVDKPNFFDCVMFGTRAEKLSQYLSKGSKVCVQGKLRWSQWEKDGQKRSKVEVVVDELDFMSSRKGGGVHEASTSTSGPAIEIEPEPLGYEDIPF